jgi:hypothetical protein
MHTATALQFAKAISSGRWRGCTETTVQQSHKDLWRLAATAVQRTTQAVIKVAHLLVSKFLDTLRCNNARTSCIPDRLQSSNNPEGAHKPHIAARWQEQKTF